MRRSRLSGKTLHARHAGWDALRINTMLDGRDDDAADLLRACELLEGDDLEGARRLIRQRHPFEPRAREKRRYSRIDMVRVFVRDGFIDRYGGERLVFPGALRLLAHLMPDELPWHPNGKMDRCHILHWTLLPSLDHFEPLARKGEDIQQNWVTTSMLRNLSKGQARLEELGWRLQPPGRIEEWDGLMGWFLAYTIRRPEVLAQVAALRKWNSVGMKLVKERLRQGTRRGRP